MVIEHTFVTTMPEEDALRLAADFLAARGFVNSEGSAFQVQMPAGSTAGGQWSKLEMERGEKSATKAKAVPYLPQMVRIEIDRGRVSLAASIAAVGRSFWWGTKELPAHSNKVRDHLELLTRISNSIEGLLARREAPEAAGAPWDELEYHLIDKGLPRSGRAKFWLILAAIFAAFMVILLIVVIVAS